MGEALSAASQLIEVAGSEPEMLARALLLSSRAAWQLADLDACFGAGMQATPAFAQVWYQRQLNALSQLLVCCNALSLKAQAELLLSRVQQCTQTLAALGARVLSQLLPMN